MKKLLYSGLFALLTIGATSNATAQSKKSTQLRKSDAAVKEAKIGNVNKAVVPGKIQKLNKETTKKKIAPSSTKKSNTAFKEAKLSKPPAKRKED